MPFCCDNFAIVSPTDPPPIIATFLSLSKFICLSVSIRIVIQKWHITPGGFAKCFAFRKTFRCTKSLKGLRTAKPPGDVAEARRDFATSFWGFAKWRTNRRRSFRFRRHVAKANFYLLNYEKKPIKLAFCGIESRNFEL